MIVNGRGVFFKCLEFVSKIETFFSVEKIVHRVSYFYYEERVYYVCLFLNNILTKMTDFIRTVEIFVLKQIYQNIAKTKNIEVNEYNDFLKQTKQIVEAKIKRNKNKKIYLFF